MAIAGTPTDPIAAATHVDPYPYYARLVAERPLYHDPKLGAWVASGAAAVAEVLAHPACRVRPVLEPVPPGLVGTPAGEIFRHLVRMNDGESHCPLKRAVSATLDTLTEERVAAETRRCAAEILAPAGSEHDAVTPLELGSVLPTWVIASLLGLTGEAVPAAARDVAELVRCVFPGGTPDEVERGKVAAVRLRDRFRDQLSRRDAATADTLLHALAARCDGLGPGAADSIIANAIGFMVQACDATAGLIGNTLVALAREPEVLVRVRRMPDLLALAVNEVARHDPPIQNTRRFLAQDATVAGEELRAGDTVLVLLAAANRDPTLNPAPHRFDPARNGPRDFTFGSGAHACPGRLAATTIAEASVAHLLDRGFKPEQLDPTPNYRSSPNARTPLLTWRRSGHGSGDGRNGALIP